MPLVRKEGKDTIIFASKEDHAEPCAIELPEPEPAPGLVLSNGDVNWNCPCLGGMATGPCGLEFREAFTCFHYSTTEPKGTDCYEAFKNMQMCMSEYPALYMNSDTDLDNLDDNLNSKDNEKLSASSKEINTKDSLKEKHIQSSGEQPDTLSNKTEVERATVN